MKIKHYLVALVALLAINLSSCKKQSEIPDTNAVAKEVSKQDPLVLTPSGWIPKSRVHLIQKDHEVNIVNGHVLEIDKISGKTIKDLGSYVPPIKNALKTQSINSIKTNTQAIPILYNANWITHAEWYNSSIYPIKYFSTNWIVPPAPVNNGQTLFIFNGLEDANTTDILQPVLQWGVSAAGGTSNTWTIGNWYVYNTNLNNQNNLNIVYTTLITVTPGTNLKGIMTFVGQNPTTGSYTYTSAFDTYANSLTVTQTSSVPSVPIQSIAVETLEAYNTNSQTAPQPTTILDYPNVSMVAMTNIKMTLFNNSAAPIIWTIGNNDSQFGMHTNLISNDSQGSGEVDIHFPRPYLNIMLSGQGISGNVDCAIIPYIPNPTTTVISWQDLNTGATGSTAGSPTAITVTGLTKFHNYKFTATCYGTGNPSSRVSDPATIYIAY